MNHRREAISLIAPAGPDLQECRYGSSAALAVLVVVYSVVRARVPSYRMMDRVPDLVGLQGMLAHVVRSGS